jgi:hypothetical protein
MELKNKRFTLRNTMERINILLDQDDPNQVDISNRLKTFSKGMIKFQMLCLTVKDLSKIL